MKHVFSFGALALGAFLMLGCAGQKPSAQSAIGCQDTSLRKDCVNQRPKVLDPPENSVQPPFASQKLPRSYPGAPPQIPHSMEGLSITQTSNSCLGCHFPGGDPVPPLPTSHLQEPVVRLEPAARPATTSVHGFKKLKDSYDQSRYFCVQCHVPQATNLKPLVKNSF